MKNFREQLWAVRSELGNELPSQYEPVRISNVSEDDAVELQNSKIQTEDIQPSKKNKINYTRSPKRAKSYGQLKMKERARRIMEDEGLDWDSALAAARERRARADAALQKPKRIYSKEKARPKVKDSKAKRRKKNAVRKASASKKRPTGYTWRSVQGGAPGLGKR